MLRNFVNSFSKRLPSFNRAFSQSLRAFAKESDDPDPKDKVKVEEEQKKEEPSSVCTYKDHEITVIGINRPHQRNAVNSETAKLICDAFSNFENDDSSPVAVLHGIGGSFCSGYDLEEMENGENVKTELLMSPEGSVGPTRRHIKKPVVCAINGFCVANGLELALMCDLRVMEECAILGFFNRRFGVPIIDGASVRLPTLIGLSRALDLILTGRQVNAKEALEMGLANRCVAHGTALGQAINLAQSIAKFPQSALNHDRNSVYSAMYEGQTFHQSIQNEIMYTSKEIMDELKEGVKKFNEGHGRKGKTAGMKEQSMADWEESEVKHENQTKKK